MWARKRKVAIAVVLFSFMLVFQPTIASAASVKIPAVNHQNLYAGIVVKEVHEDYVVIDISTTDPDVIHVPIHVLPDGTKVAKGVLQKSATEKDVLMTLTLDDQQDTDEYTLVMNQDWPQNWNKLIIKLGEQDWPQYEEIIIPLDFQDWPQNWLPAMLA